MAMKEYEMAAISEGTVQLRDGTLRHSPERQPGHGCYVWWYKLFDSCVFSTEVGPLVVLNTILCGCVHIINVQILTL